MLELLIERGITYKEILYEIKTLNEAHCCILEPEADHDPTEAPPGDIWKFKKEIGGENLYIKIKVPHDPKDKNIKVLSIHRWTGRP